MNKTIMKKKGIALAMLLALFAIISPIVYAAGVAAPYWDSNPLYLEKGETKVVNFELQNMVGSNDLTFQVRLESPDGIANLDSTQDTYTVPTGQKVEVPIKVVMPTSANSESSYKVKLVTQEVKSSEPGQFSMGSAFENSFDVRLMPPKPAAANVESASDTKYIIYLIAGTVLLGLVIYFFERKRTKSKNL